MPRPLLALTTLITAATTALTGCSNTSNASSANKSSAMPTPVGTSLVDTAPRAGTLTVCTTGDYLPYTYRNPKTGTYNGLDIDLVNSFAKSLAVKVTFVPTTWKNLSADFGTKCELAVGGISGTIDRARIAFFSTAYLTDGKTPVTKCTNVTKYDTIAKINKPTVTSITPAGGTNEKFARSHYPHGKILVWNDNTTIFTQILNGKADVMTTDATEARWAQKTYKGLCAVHANAPFTQEQRVWLLPRGDTIFQEYVNQWFTIAKEQGEFTTLESHWLG